MGQARDIHQETGPAAAVPAELSEALSTVRELVTRLVDERPHAVLTACVEMERLIGEQAPRAGAVARTRRVERGQPVVTGVAIAFIGYTSTSAAVLAGLRAVGASPAEAASGLVALCATLGLGTLWLSRRRRMPITAAWSTPGAAVLASAGCVTGGWQAAVGGFLVSGGLVVLTGFWPRLSALVASIPASIAQAMRAGVLRRSARSTPKFSRRRMP